METLLQDLRFAVRTLIKRPGFAAVVVATLGLGIGATSSIFSVVSFVLLRSLPYRDPGALVRVWQSLPKQNTQKAPTSAANFTDWKERNQVFTGMAAFAQAAFNLTGGDQPERLVGGQVSPNAFALLGVDPILGRTFTPQDGDQANVVLSFGLWQRRFGGNPAVVGRTIILNSAPYLVLGVMPADFKLVSGAELWTPLVWNAQALRQRGALLYNSFARLKPGVTLTQAQRNLDAVAVELGQEYGVNRNRGVTVTSWREEAVGDLAGTLLVLLGAVGFVLLVTCANVANLLLARSTERIKEIAVRTALGADRRRLIRQSLTEGLVLAAGGGGLGLLATGLGIKLLVGLNTARIPNLHEISIDWWVVGFTAAVTLVTGVVFGLVPALQVSRALVHEALKEGGRGSSASHPRNLLRNGLVVAEVSLALVLMIGAGLLIRSFQRLQRVDPGFQPQGAMAMRISLPANKYPSSAQRVFFFQQAVEQIERLPGVQSAGAVTTLPMSGDELKLLFQIPGREITDTNQAVNLDLVTPGYFRAMGIALLKGRPFTARDRAGAAPVVIIDEALARRFWPNESPVGRYLFLPGFQKEKAEIVGVVRSVRREGLDQAVQPQAYIPLTDLSDGFMEVVVRSRTPPKALAAAVRGAVWTVDRDQPISDMLTLTDLVKATCSQQNFSARVMEVFALLALALAVAGIHGVLSYWVTQRTHELGVRMALGGNKREVRGLVLRHGLRLTATGLAIGLALALGLTRVIANLLFGVGATDPLTFLSLPAMLFGVALLACWLPARKATAVDPVLALRHE